MQNLILFLLITFTFVFALALVILYFQVRLLKEHILISTANSKSINTESNLNKKPLIVNPRKKNSRKVDTFEIKEKLHENRILKNQIFDDQSLEKKNEILEVNNQSPVFINPNSQSSDTVKDLEEKEKFLFKSKMQKQVTFLSNKELDVCYYIWKSYNSKQIAEILHMSHASARVIKNKVRQKLALNSSTELKSFLIEMIRE